MFDKPMQVLVVGTGHSGANFTIRVLDALGYPCGDIVDSRHGNDNSELYNAAHNLWDNLDLDKIPPVVKSHNFGFILDEWIVRGRPKPEYIIVCYRDPTEVQRRVSEEDGVERLHVEGETIQHNTELLRTIRKHQIKSTILEFPNSKDPQYFYDTVDLFKTDNISYEQFKVAHKKIYKPEWARGEKW